MCARGWGPGEVAQEVQIDGLEKQHGKHGRLLAVAPVAER